MKREQFVILFFIAISLIYVFAITSCGARQCFKSNLHDQTSFKIKGKN